MSNSNLKSAEPYIEQEAKIIYLNWEGCPNWKPWDETGDSELKARALSVARTDLRSRGFILHLDGQWVLTATGEFHYQAKEEELAETDYSVYAKGFKGGEAYSVEPQQVAMQPLVFKTDGREYKLNFTGSLATNNMTIVGNANEVLIRVSKDGVIEEIDKELIYIRAKQGNMYAVMLQALLERTGEEVDYLRFLAAHFTGTTAYGMNFVLKAINVAYEATGKKVPDSYKVNV